MDKKTKWSLFALLTMGLGLIIAALTSNEPMKRKKGTR